MTLTIGQEGRYFEDFQVGDLYQHGYGRTVTDTDNIWFTNLTMNANEIHFNHHYASQTLFQRPLVNSCFTLALVTGLSVADVSKNGMNLQWTEVKMPNPLFEGDTVYAQTEVLAKRESASRPEFGIVTVKTQGYTEKGQVVIEFTRTILIYKRDHAPRRELPKPRSTT